MHYWRKCVIGFLMKAMLQFDVFKYMLLQFKSYMFVMCEGEIWENYLFTISVSNTPNFPGQSISCSVFILCCILTCSFFAPRTTKVEWVLMGSCFDEQIYCLLFDCDYICIYMLMLIILLCWYVLPYFVNEILLLGFDCRIPYKNYHNIMIMLSK